MATRISLGFAGALAIGYGCMHLLMSNQFSNSVLDRIRALEPASAAAVRGLRAGESVLVEGTISPANAKRFGSFVAYKRSSNAQPSNQIDAILADEEQVAPPLQVAVAGGEVRLEEKYFMPQTPHGKLTKLYSYDGFHRGDKVFAVGTASGHGTIRAEALYGGTRDKYLFKQTGETWVSYAGNVFLILLGGLLLSVAVLSRRKRSPVLVSR